MDPDGNGAIRVCVGQDMLPNYSYQLVCRLVYELVRSFYESTNVIFLRPRTRLDIKKIIIKFINDSLRRHKK